MPFVLASAVMLVAFVPLGVVAARGRLPDALVAYEAASSIVVLILLLLPEGFNRPSELQIPVLFAVLLLGGGLVFVHALERWL